MKKMITPFRQIEGSQSSVFFESLWSYANGAESLYDTYRQPAHKEVDPRLCGFYLPPFQRPEVWTIEQKARFIESCFLGLDIGRIVVASCDPDAECNRTYGWLIDGQQRLTAIRDFMAGVFTIFNQISFKDIWEDRVDYGNDWYQYQHKPEPPKRVLPWAHWKHMSLPMVIVRNSSPEVLEKMYNAMNYGGTPHEQPTFGRRDFQFGDLVSGIPPIHDLDKDDTDILGSSEELFRMEGLFVLGSEKSGIAIILPVQGGETVMVQYRSLIMKRVGNMRDQVENT